MLAPDAVKRALVAYYDLRGEVLLTGIHIDRLSRLGIGIGQASNADAIVGQVEAVALSMQPCVMCRSHPPSVCEACSRASTSARRTR